MDNDSCIHCGSPKLAARAPRTGSKATLRLDCMACGRYLKHLSLSWVEWNHASALQLFDLPAGYAYELPIGRLVQWAPKGEDWKLAKKAKSEAAWAAKMARKAAKAKSADPLQDFSRTKRKNRRRRKNRQS